MTEPPQPPNQPPSPSGYGHLPGPPQQGYGYPPQGPNPYAQQPPTVPQPLAQQGGYGFPPPGPGTPPGPPAPGGRGGRRKGAIIVAAAVAGVLVLGTGAWFTFLSDDDGSKKPAAQASAPTDPKPAGSPSVDKGDGSGNGMGEQTDLNAGRKPGEDKALWLKTAKLLAGGDTGIPAPAMWVVGDSVVKTVGKSVIAYAVTDGKEKWKVDFKTEICGWADQTTADGKTVLAVKDGEGSNATCNQMKLFDLKAGKEGWTKELAKENLFDGGGSVSMNLTGDVFVVNRMANTTVHKLSTGDKLFSGNTPEGCQPTHYAAGNGKLLAVALCMDDDKTIEVQDADPVTGKKTWSYRLPKGFRVTSVLSVSPIVLDISNRDLNNADDNKRAIISLTPDGKKRASMSAEGSFETNCNASTSDSLQGCGNSVVDGDTLYLRTTTSKGFDNEVVAFDLATGKAKWRQKAGDKRNWYPVKAANGQLIAYRAGALREPGEIVSMPAAGGQPKTLLRMPSGPSANIESAMVTYQVRAFEDGRYFTSASRLNGNNTEERLLMVFGK
ncbi:PQQ-binding-like beta-propeller repeat protein [Streptomyces sp. C]|uniref:outer membrane protein assembly factor BamB family protein n=1 Tax=Streptomyces sp. C TaxID=253839 RepID=UPI0001B5679A|nr:PQQ-binding-like beta-propeller repeat protein [Streptomyces sp. C]EFL15625.1 secreted protein [Streptomyces sp. C]